MYHPLEATLGGHSDDIRSVLFGLGKRSRILVCLCACRLYDNAGNHGTAWSTTNTAACAITRCCPIATASLACRHWRAITCCPILACPCTTSSASAIANSA